MRLLLFNQYDRLLAKFKAIASDCARDATDWKICRVQSSNGIVHLHDRTMNVLNASGGETRIVAPDIDPERARQFCLRVTAEGDNTLTFTGAEAFEAANADALSPPTDGQTVIYRFTETLGDRLYVERKVVGYAI